MSYRPQVKADSNGTTQDLPIDAETVQGKTPVFTTTNQTISGVKTYNGNQVFTGYLDIRGTAAEKHLKTRGIGGSDGNGSESDLYLQYNSSYSTKFGKTGTGSLNSDGTITEAGTLLSNKYAAKATTLSGYGITDAYTKTETDDKLNGKSGIGHTHAIASTNKDGFMSSTQVGLLNGLHNILHHYYGGTYGDATNIDSPNGTYSMQIGDSGFTIDDGPPDSNPNNILQINADVFTYNGYKVLTSNDSGYLTKVESVIDYGNTSNTIKIGYRGNGLTASQIAYIAGYSVDDPNNPTEHKIKDISKDVLKSWLGYTEVSSGIMSPGSTLTATSGYVWIVYPYDDTANTFKFTYGSGERTGYGFAIVQGGGCIRYFQSATQLTRYSISSITFTTQIVYIKFKI